MENITVLYFINVICLFLLLVITIAVLLSKNLVISSCLLGAFSLIMSTEYIILGAPDVAITEAAVGAGISTVFLLSAIALVGSKEKKEAGRMFMPKILSFMGFLILAYTVVYMPVFCDVLSPSRQNSMPYYISNSWKDIGIPNMVTSILASYRAFDTFGETIVVFTASISIYIILFKRKNLK